MLVPALKSPFGVRQLCALAVAALICVTTPCMAQSRGGGGGGMGQPPKPRDSGPGKPDDNRPTGTGSGWIMKYVPPKEGEDEDVLAYLTFKPAGKTPPVKVRVMRDLPVEFDFGEKKEYEQEEYPELLTRGLFCTFSWKTAEPEDGKKTTRLRNRDLTQVSFDRLDITGKIVEVRSDRVVIRGRPANDLPWPGTVTDSGTPGRSGAAAKPRPVPLRKLDLRILDDVTKFVDLENKLLDTADFEPNHEVEASIVFGRRGGIAVTVKSPTIRSEGGDEDRSADGRGGGGRPPPPPPPG